MSRSNDSRKFVHYATSEELQIFENWNYGIGFFDQTYDCVKYYPGFGLSSISCDTISKPICKVIGFVEFTLDGVCKESVVDSHYILTPNGILTGKGSMKTKHVIRASKNECKKTYVLEAFYHFFKVSFDWTPATGFSYTEIIYNENEHQWEIWNKKEGTLAAFTNETNTFPLGLQNWYFDDVPCQDNNKSWRELNLHLKATKPGKFCCDDGACMDSSLACDGDYHCDDGSDEIESNCKLITTNKGYRIAAPPKRKEKDKVVS